MWVENMIHIVINEQIEIILIEIENIQSENQIV